MAEPRGDPKRNLVAVPSESPRPGFEPTAGARSSDPAVPAAAAATTRAARSRREPWLLLALAIAVVVAIVQSQRFDLAAERAAALSDQVVGLEGQLVAAETQLRTYEMLHGQIQDSVSDLSERVMLLAELVGGDPSLSSAPAP